LNDSKCTLSVINKSKQTKMENMEIKNIVSQVKYLGVIIDLKQLCWKNHILSTHEKVNTIILRSIELSIIGGELTIDLQRRYYTQMIRPMIEYGARIMTLNKTLMNKLEILQHRVLTKITHTHFSAKRSATRLLLGIPPIEARYDFMLLSGYYTFIKDKQDLLVGKLVRKEQEYTNMNEDRINGGDGNHEPMCLYSIDVLSTLTKYNLQQYWKPEELPTSLFIWKSILKTQIYDYHFQRDKDDMGNNEHMKIFMDIVTALQEPHEIYPKIYAKLLDKDEHNGYLLKVITDNINICWKQNVAQGRRLIIGHCKWCEEEWENPVQHLLLECIETQGVFDSTKSSDNEKDSPLICDGQLTINELKRRCSILEKILK
ncbi:hypothetical protein RFI_38564, partial [Reticulomyxa filosa]